MDSDGPIFILLDQAYGSMSMVLDDGGTDENGGGAPFEDGHHEHYGPTSNGFSGQHGNDQQCIGDPFFDWCELDEAFKKQRHEALAQKVKELVAKMRWRRSKAFWSIKKKDEKEQRMNMRQMQRMRKSGNTMSTYFNWEELDKVEEEMEMGHRKMQTLHFPVAQMKETCTPMSSYFDWQELEIAEDEEQKELDKRKEDEIKAMRSKLARSTSNIDLKTMRQQDELKENRKNKRMQSIEAMSKMKESKQKQHYEARGG